MRTRWIKPAIIWSTELVGDPIIAIMTKFTGDQLEVPVNYKILCEIYFLKIIKNLSLLEKFVQLKIQHEQGSRLGHLAFPKSFFRYLKNCLLGKR